MHRDGEPGVRTGVRAGTGPAGLDRRSDRGPEDAGDRYRAVVAVIEVQTLIAASPEAVWADLADIASHVEWMADAESIRFTSEHRSGTGTTFDCVTKVGPIRLTDRMEVTAWDPPRTMGVRHVGVVTGTGAFELSADGAHTTFRWREELVFPWWLLGPVGAAVGKVVLAAVWRANLRRLAARFDR